MEEIEKDGVGGVCSTNRRDYKCLHNFNLYERYHLGDLGFDEVIRIKWLLKKQYANLGWIRVSQSRTKR